jgi:uncharacterized membrane protein YhdT
MKTKKKWIFGAAFLLLPILFAVIMQREVAGAVTIFTFRGTTLRVYQSDSGNLALARRSNSERLEKPEWLVTRSNKAAWWAANVSILYIQFPFLLGDLLNPQK